MLRYALIYKFSRCVSPMTARSDPERISRLSAEYGALLDGFIKEASPFATREQLLAHMDILPIIFNGVRAGIVGLTLEPTKVGKVAIIKLLYLEPQYRKEKLGPVLENLFVRFKAEGITHVEGWALPYIADWLEEHWKVTPKLKVYHEDLGRLMGRIAEIKTNKS